MDVGGSIRRQQEERDRRRRLFLRSDAFGERYWPFDLGSVGLVLGPGVALLGVGGNNEIQTYSSQGRIASFQPGNSLLSFDQKDIFFLG